MRTILALLFLGASLAAPVDAQEAQGWEKTGGPTLTRETVEQGAYVRLRAQGSADTLWVWVEHVPEGARPDMRSARQADAVLICEPQRFDVTPLTPHLRARVGLVEIPDRGRLWIIPEGSGAWDTYYEKQERPLPHAHALLY